MLKRLSKFLSANQRLLYRIEILKLEKQTTELALQGTMSGWREGYRKLLVENQELVEQQTWNDVTVDFPFEFTQHK